MHETQYSELKILLIEDNPGDRDLIIEYLEESGKSFKVETVATLEEAIISQSGRNADVVIMDLNVPDSIGLETLVRFKSEVANIPIIVLTGLDDGQVGLEAIRLGAQDYLVKGKVNANLLDRALRYAIERQTLEGQYHTLFTNMQQGVVYHDVVGNIVQANPSALRILGMTIDQVLQRNIYDEQWEGIHDDCTACSGINCPALRALNSGQPETEFLRIFNPKEQAFRWIRIHSIPEISDSNKKPTGVFSTFEDLTDLRQAQDDLLENEERIKSQHRFLQMLLDAIPISVFYKDLKGLYVGCNNTFASFIGKSKEEIIGKTVEEILPKDIADWCNEVEKEIIENHQTRQYETTLKFKDGLEYDVLFNKAAYFDDIGNMLGIIGAMLNVTDRKKMEKQLIQSQKMESIGTLAGGIAHDFNNILSAILGFTELSLDMTEKESDLESNLLEVYAAGARAKDLVKQILLFARASADETKPVQLVLIVKEVLKFIRSSIPSTIDIKHRLESNSFITGNATQIHQVLMNLCTNASHSMAEKGGSLNVTVKNVFININSIDLDDLKHGEYIELRVADTGEGIAPENLISIFDPYFTTKKIGEGTGLGLAMVHGIVESYKGRILVDSELGVGTTFTIYLPIIKTDSTETEYKSEQSPSGNETILFVDDEITIVRVGKKILESLGYSVVSTTNSLEALEIFRTNPTGFDLVISDLTMPNLTGSQLAIELINIRPDIPIIICSGYSKVISEAEAKDIGIKAWAQKPILKLELAKTVKKVLTESKK